MKIIKKIEHYFNEYECSYKCYFVILIIISVFEFIYNLNFNSLFSTYWPVFVENIENDITGYFYQIPYTEISLNILHIPAKYSHIFAGKILAPLLEEIIYRFFLFEIINRVIIKNKFYASCVTSIFFALAHLYSFSANSLFYNIINLRLILLFIFGLLFQKIYIDKGLLSSILFHSLSNIVIVIYIYLHHLAWDIYIYLHHLAWDIYIYLHHLLMDLIIVIIDFLLKIFFNE